MIDIIPKPKHVSISKGTLRADKFFIENNTAEKQLNLVFQECVEEIIGSEKISSLKDSSVCVRFFKLALEQKFNESPESYRIYVDSLGVRIEAISLRGLIYGIHTLIAITKITSEREFEIPYCYIEDWPDFTMRGMQDDPARGQVSTISNYKRLIRELSRLKYNVLTFHTDDMFRFERYPDIGKQSGALTKSEWSQLVEYGHIYGLDLFLTFQTFGHAGHVTSMPAYNKYSDVPGEASHYSPAIPEVYDFLDSLFSEISEVFDSDTFHIGCDEVVLQSEGMISSQMVREQGPASVYIGHVKKVAQRAQKYWKRILFFGEFADNRYTPPVKGDIKDIYSLRDAGLTFVNWNYYDYKWEDYFHYLNTLNRCGVDQVISTGIWTWRQLFPNYFQTCKTLPLFTDLAFREGVKESITCAWNDTTDCFRELNYLNYAFAAEHQWNAGLFTENPATFVSRWVKQFFGTDIDVLRDAYLWLGDLNRLVYEGARHDHRFPREYNWQTHIAHAVFWNYPVPLSGTKEDADISQKKVDYASDLRERLKASKNRAMRNQSVIDLVIYELHRAEWLFDSVVFCVNGDRNYASKLSKQLHNLKDDFMHLWNLTNIVPKRERIGKRFDKLISLYEKESKELTPWNGVWGPEGRMQIGPWPE